MAKFIETETGRHLNLDHVRYPAPHKKQGRIYRLSRRR